MNKKQIRLVMPETLHHRIQKFDGGNQTRFILEAVQAHLRRLEEEELERELAEGYRVRNDERLRLAEDHLGVAAECMFTPERA